MTKAKQEVMDWAERKEYYDLITEEISFAPKKGQKWIMSFEERHTYAHDIVFHVYSEKGDYMLLAYEIADVMKLDLKERLHKLNETLSGNLRIYLTTLKAELPGELKHDTSAKDGSRFKLSFTYKDRTRSYEWEFPTGDDFKRIRPVLKLIWAVDGWQEGAKAMGWSDRKAKARKTLGDDGKEKRARSQEEKSSKRGRIDPFGSIW